MSEQITQNTPPVKVLLLGLDMGQFDAERSMDELLPFGFGPSNVAGNRAVK